METTVSRIARMRNLFIRVLIRATWCYFLFLAPQTLRPGTKTVLRFPTVGKSFATSRRFKTPGKRRSPRLWPGNKGRRGGNRCPALKKTVKSFVSHDDSTSKTGGFRKKVSASSPNWKQWMSPVEGPQMGPGRRLHYRRSIGDTLWMETGFSRNQMRSGSLPEFERALRRSGKKPGADCRDGFALGNDATIEGGLPASRGLGIRGITELGRLAMAPRRRLIQKNVAARSRRLDLGPGAAYVRVGQKESKARAGHCMFGRVDAPAMDRNLIDAAWTGLPRIVRDGCGKESENQISKSLGQR